MFSIRTRLVLRVAPFLLIALAGCGGSKVVKVTGTLTYKGKPVTNAYLDFVPKEGRPSWGQTDEQGHFTLNYEFDQQGAVRGKHRVSVRMRPSTTAEQEAIMNGQQPPLSKDMAEFFQKYSVENSKVEVTIDRNPTDLKLDWD
jgi:hypothetical protein